MKLLLEHSIFLTLCWQIKITDIKIMEFIACQYDSFWWIGLVKEINHEQGDILVKFMHPHEPSRTFKWLAREDLCWVPFDKFMCKKMTGRMYQISEGDYTKIMSVCL